jgi:hypothetical protein
VRIRFRFQSTTGGIGTGQGWHVEDINLNSDDFTTVSEPAVSETSQPLTGRPNNTYVYRVAALFGNPNPLDPNTEIVGPYSNSRCVTVSGVVGAVSRKIHGSAGTFDIRLPLNANPPIPNIRGIEPRRGSTGGRHRIVFQFPSPVTNADNAMVTGQVGAPSIIARDAGPGPNEYTVELTNVANAQTITLTLVGVRNASGTNLGDFSVPMGMLLGDTTGDGAVNAGDSQQARNNSGQLTGAANFRSDVNVDGTVNTGDAIIIRNNSGAALP